MTSGTHSVWGLTAAASLSLITSSIVSFGFDPDAAGAGRGIGDVRILVICWIASCMLSSSMKVSSELVSYNFG